MDTEVVRTCSFLRPEHILVINVIRWDSIKLSYCHEHTEHELAVSWMLGIEQWYKNDDLL